MAFSSKQKQRQDLSFSSTDEIKSYINSNIGGFGQSDIDQYKQTHIEGIPKKNPLQLGLYSIYNGIFNPVAYNGQTYLELQNAWKTNEIGFLIGASFMLVIINQVTGYKRQSLQLQKKRFIYMQYKRQRFLEDSLMMKTRDQIIREGLFENVIKK